MIKPIKTFALFVLLVALTGCKNDEGFVYPDIVKEIVTLKTNAGGDISMIITDNDETYLINQNKLETKLKANSYYRTVSNYVPVTLPTAESYGIADLYSATGVFTGTITPASEFPDGYNTDPADVVRIWESGNFINMELLVPAQNGNHSFGFVNEGKESGTNNVVIKILHDSNGDYPAYKMSAYLSLLPNDLYNTGDSVCIRINTFEGFQDYVFSLKK